MRFNRRSQDQTIGAGDSFKTIVSFATPHPWHDLSVTEADDQFHLHPHLAMQSLDDPDDVRVLATRRHEIDQANSAALGFDFRFKNQRLAPIPAANCFNFFFREKTPVPVFTVAQQRCKTRARIKSREAKPIDASVTTHQRTGLRVTEKPVVLDLCIFLCHCEFVLLLVLLIVLD